MKKYLPTFVFLVITLLVFLTNTLHEEYPDEYDSLVGGRYLNEGKIIYKDWFQHHQPLAYVWASGLLHFSGISFVKFRILLAVSFFLLNIGAYFLLKKRLKRVDLRFYLVFIFLVAVSTTYFWGQMLLADTLSAYLIIPALAILLLKDFYRERFEAKDLLIFSLFAFLAWLTSMTFIFLLGGLYLYALLLFFKNQRKPWRQAILILGLPYALFLIYLIFSGSLKDYYFANFTYNRFYIYNYPGLPGSAINPFRYAIVIAYKFINDFLPLLANAKNFVLSEPFNTTLAISNVGFLILLFLRKRYLFLFPFLIALVYSNTRSSPIGIHETDYQSSVYIMISFLVGIFSLFSLGDFLNSRRELLSAKVIAGFVLLVLSLFWFFNGLFVGQKFLQKFYPKYMGQAPLIYDWPEATPIINKVVAKDEYAWIGPFEFKELFYLQPKVPSKYHWFLDQAVKFEEIKTKMISDFEKNRAKVIVFEREYAPWGGEAETAKTFNYFFTDFLDKNYFRLDSQYQWQIGSTRNFDLNQDFYFDRQSKDEMIKRLLNSGLIKEK